MKKKLFQKSQPVSKQMVWQAWQSVKANMGGPGVDGQTIESFQEDQSKQLYKIWNRMASGSYRPPAVKEVLIPKGKGGYRRLGIPTVGDRIAQTVVKNYLEPRMESLFHPDSYGYRPGKSAHDAVEQTRQRCWHYGWVIDLDIKGFFDNLDHSLLNRALDGHVPEKWCRMYIDRWLKISVSNGKGEEVPCSKGTPQGGVISPLLANLFLHYAFDAWMSKYHKDVLFERYADDIIIHCSSQEKAEKMLKLITDRLASCNLEVHPEKTQIVFCPQQGRKSSYPRRKFSFLGFDFKADKVKNAAGQWFTGFGPRVGQEAISKLLGRLSKLKIHRWTNNTLEGIGELLNPTLRGWINYFGKFSKWRMRKAFEVLNYRLLKWVRQKYKRFKQLGRARAWLKQQARRYPSYFAHWQAGFIPT